MERLGGIAEGLILNLRMDELSECRAIVILISRNVIFGDVVVST